MPYQCTLVRGRRELNLLSSALLVREVWYEGGAEFCAHVEKQDVSHVSLLLLLQASQDGNFRGVEGEDGGVAPRSEHLLFHLDEFPFVFYLQPWLQCNYSESLNRVESDASLFHAAEDVDGVGQVAATGPSSSNFKRGHRRPRILTNAIALNSGFR